MNILVRKPYNGGKDIFIIKDAKLKFKNFSGKQGKPDRNQNGSRTVNVVVDEEDKILLEGKGYTVNIWLNPKTNDYEYTVRLNIKMQPGNMAKIRQRVGNNPEFIYLDAISIDGLDGCVIAHADVAWSYGINHHTGKPVAYLNEMDVVIVPSIFAEDSDDYYIESHD